MGEENLKIKTGQPIIIPLNTTMAMRDSMDDFFTAYSITVNFIEIEGLIYDHIICAKSFDIDSFKRLLDAMENGSSYSFDYEIVSGTNFVPSFKVDKGILSVPVEDYCYWGSTHNYKVHAVLISTMKQFAASFDTLMGMKDNKNLKMLKLPNEDVPFMLEETHDDRLDWYVENPQKAKLLKAATDIIWNVDEDEEDEEGEKKKKPIFV